MGVESMTGSNSSNTIVCSAISAYMVIVPKTGTVRASKKLPLELSSYFLTGVEASAGWVLTVDP